MRWPFRRAQAQQASQGLEVPPPLQVPAWQRLSGGLSTLGPMPTTLDTAFSDTLPTRWRTASALRPLGHDVRTDVPGGLVSGVAQTVGPRDTRPADLVWRVAALLGAAAGQDPAEAVTKTAAKTAQKIPATAPTAIVPPTRTPPAGGRMPDGLTVTGALGRVPTAADTVKGTASGSPVSPSTARRSTPTAMSPESAPASKTSKTSGGDQPAEPGAGPQTSVPPVEADASAPAGTAETRQVSQDATAVESREPRPVPADVTDGPPRAAPDQGVNAEPRPVTLASPPSSPITGAGGLLTPREARPGPDPLGSAPAVAPLVAHDPIARTVRADAAAASRSTDSGRTVTAGSPQVSQASGPVKPPRSAARGAEQKADVQHLSGSEPTPTPSPMAAPGPSGIAPLVSAVRTIAAASPISILRAPAAPAGQPIRDAASIADTFAVPAHGAPASELPVSMRLSAPGGQPSPVSQTSSSPLSTPSRSLLSVSTRQPPVPQRRTLSVSGGQPPSLPHLSTPDGQAAPSPAPPTPAPTHVSTSNGHASASPTPSPPPSSPPLSSPPEDPAALDALARQLYGRFSRHLAGELLIDRERAQFLTDLS